MAGPMVAPRWLEPMLKASFFSVCRAHGDAARSECNMFCLDCDGDAFCYFCRSSSHKDHQVIQIRRSSYHDVVRVSEVQKALDISGVQTYVINSARVMFLNERPQPKGSSTKGVGPHLCEICRRSLLDPFRFCSLGCKLVGVKTNGDATFAVDPNNEVVATERRGGELVSKRATSSSRRKEEVLVGSQGMCPPHPYSNARRRKGIPHRAPFGS